MKELKITLSESYPNAGVFYLKSLAIFVFGQKNGSDRYRVYLPDGESKIVNKDEVLNVVNKNQIENVELVDLIKDEAVYAAKDINDLFSNKEEALTYVLQLHNQIKVYKNLITHGSIYGDVQDSFELEDSNDSEEFGEDTPVAIANVANEEELVQRIYGTTKPSKFGAGWKTALHNELL